MLDDKRTIITKLEENKHSFFSSNTKTKTTNQIRDVFATIIMEEDFNRKRL